MRRSLLAAALCLSACGGAPAEAPQTVAVDEPDGAIDVETLHCVGDAPPPERTVRISVDGEGVLRVDGSEVDLARLRETLRERAGSGPAAEPADVDALLVLDRMLPWQAAQVLMQECAGARIGRIFFEVRHGNETTGAISAFLPVDAPVLRPPGDPVPKLVLRVRDDGEPSDPMGLASFPGVNYDGDDFSQHVEIDAAPSTPVGFVLAPLDGAALLDAGAVTFVGTPVAMGETDLAAIIDTARSQPAARHVTVWDAPLPPYSGERLNIPRMTGAYAGFAAHPNPDSEPEVELVEEETDER
jgi:hypothetical protein